MKRGDFYGEETLVLENEHLLVEVLATAGPRIVRLQLAGSGENLFGEVADAGWEKFYLDHAGYGVGLRQSEFYPIIGKGRTEIIEAGMVVDLLLPTIYKRDIGGPRVTDCIYVGEKANEILTDYPRDLIRV